MTDLIENCINSHSHPTSPAQIQKQHQGNVQIQVHFQIDIFTIILLKTRIQADKEQG
jgi:hypothetical protein